MQQVEPDAICFVKSDPKQMNSKSSHHSVSVGGRTGGEIITLGLNSAPATHNSRGLVSNVNVIQCFRPMWSTMNNRLCI